MPSQVHLMTPLLPEEADDLQDLALEVIQKSAALGSRQHPMTLDTLRELLRIINSYYSNLAQADAPRRNDLDGRGNLSDEGLARMAT